MLSQNWWDVKIQKKDLEVAVAIFEQLPVTIIGIDNDDEEYDKMIITIMRGVFE